MSSTASTHETDETDTGVVISFKRLTTDSIVPTVSTRGSAGMDIASRVSAVIPVKEWITVPTGIAIEIPRNCYARIAPRSGLAFQYGLMINAGVIDSDYRGEIKVIIYNPGTTAYRISAGDKIAQLIFERIYAPADLMIRVVNSEDLTSSERGDQGFGSTERREADLRNASIDSGTN